MILPVGHGSIQRKPVNPEKQFHLISSQFRPSFAITSMSMIIVESPSPFVIITISAAFVIIVVIIRVIIFVIICVIIFVIIFVIISVIIFVIIVKLILHLGSRCSALFDSRKPRSLTNVIKNIIKNII